MANKLYREITNAILAKLEKGVVPWRKDWRSTASAAIPHNVVSKRPYSGVNVILLWLKGQQRGWSSLEFLTFKQAAEAGGTVRHGEKSTGIVFVKQLQVPDRKEPEKIKLVPILRAYRVFHVTQCENLPESLTRPLPKAPRNHDSRRADIDEFMTSTGADIHEGSGEPAYSLANDVITVPHFSDFATADRFYSTTFHELAHWTGAKHRLNRDMRGRFGDQWADTTTPHGKLMITILGGLAEFERSLILARTSEGRRRAKERGVHMGRPPKLTPHQRREAIARRQAGETLTDIARSYAVSHTTIGRL
jgi:antirestriction protein ArdC